MLGLAVLAQELAKVPAERHDRVPVVLHDAVLLLDQHAPRRVASRRGRQVAVGEQRLVTPPGEVGGDGGAAAQQQRAEGGEGPLPEPGTVEGLRAHVHLVREAHVVLLLANRPQVAARAGALGAALGARVVAVDEHARVDLAAARRLERLRQRRHLVLVGRRNVVGHADKLGAVGAPPARRDLKVLLHIDERVVSALDHVAVRRGTSQAVRRGHLPVRADGHGLRLPVRVVALLPSVPTVGARTARVADVALGALDLDVSVERRARLRAPRLAELRQAGRGWDEEDQQL